MILPSAREVIKTPEWSCPATQALGPTPPSSQSLPMPHAPSQKSALSTALASVPAGEMDTKIWAFPATLWPCLNTTHGLYSLKSGIVFVFFCFVLKDWKSPSLPVNPHALPQASRIACLLQEGSPESTHTPSQMRSPASGSHSFCTNLQHFPPHTPLEPLTSPIP